MMMNLYAARLEWYWTGKPKYSEKNLNQLYSSTTDSTQTDLGFNSGLRSGGQW